MTQFPDIIVTNGSLLTMCPERPHAGALAITGNRITAIGSTDEITALQGPATRRIDACGATVLPGIVESHVHLFCGAAELDYLDMFGREGLEVVTEAVHEFAAQNQEDEMILVVGATYEVLGLGVTMSRQALDRILPDRPFAIVASDLHTVWANTAALEKAGLLQGGDAGKGSQIVMGPDGLAQGTLKEAGAFGPVLKLARYGGRELMGMITGADPLPAPTPAQREMDKDVLERGLDHCARQGITSLHNMDGNLYTLALLTEMEQEGRLKCRVEIPFHYKNFDSLDRFEEAVAMRAAYQGEKLHCDRVKLFADGVIESRTALMIENYPGTSANGDAIFDEEVLRQICITADGMGFQIAVHAIGDLAVRWTLDAYEAAQTVNGVRDSRHRIEHIETIHPEDLPRLGSLGVVASLQPGHAPCGGFFPAHDIGNLLHEKQISTAYAWSDIRASARRTIFSSDWPVIPVDVMRNIRAAIAPRPMPAPWRSHAQSLQDTLRSCTADGAWVEFAEDIKGMLRPDMLADVVIMSHDLEALAPEDICEAHAVTTICDGEITWQTGA